MLTDSVWFLRLWPSIRLIVIIAAMAYMIESFGVQIPLAVSRCVWIVVGVMWMDYFIMFNARNIEAAVALEIHQNE